MKNKLTPIPFLLLGSTLFGFESTHASSQIKLSSDQLRHRIAVPFEFSLQLNSSKLSNADKKNQKDEFAQAQAQLECLSQICDKSPCTESIAFTLVQKPAEKNAKLRLKDDSQSGSILSTRPWAFSIADEPILEDYFESIECSNGSEKKTLSRTEIEPLIQGLHEMNSASLEQSPSCCSNQVVQNENSFQSKSKKRARDEGSNYFSDGIKKLKTMASSFRTVGYYGSHALCLGSSIAAKSAVDYLTSPPMHNENPWFTVCKFAINNLGLKQIAGPYLDQRIKKSVDALTPDSLKTGDAKLMAELEKRARSLKEEYLKIKDDPRVFEENRSYLKAYIEKSEKSLEYLKGNRAFDPSIPSRLDEISAFLDAIQKTLSFPKEVKRIDFKTSEEEIKSLTTNVDRNLGVQIQRIGKSIALASQNTDHSMNSKKIYYLKGHPGTGKTFLANGIAKALGLPFLETKMSGLQQDGTFPINSEIARFLGNNESKNAVIFIDEAGDLFHSLRDNNPLNSLTLSELKKLLDPDNLKIEDRTIPKTQAMHQSTQRIFQDLSKVTFILTGNYEIEEEALKSRITTLEFPKVSLKDRKKIAQIIWEKNSSGLPLDESTQRVLEEITQKTDEKFDGVREMKTIIQNYIVERSSNPDQPFNVDEELKAFTKKPATELTPSQGSPSPAPSASP